MPRNAQVRVGTIENSGPNTLVSYLRNAGSDATEIDIAVAFVTLAGLDSVLHLLKKTASHGVVRFLTGFYQGFNEPKALKALLREQTQSQGRFSVQISADSHFHWKAYFLVGKSSANVVIGSSNLTAEGLARTGEFNAVLSMPKVSPQFRDLHSVFDRHWNSKSHPLTKTILASYEKWRTSQGISIPRQNVPIKKILGSEASEKRPRKIIEPHFWRTCIDGFLSEKTESLLSETTDWERRGYFYFSTSPNFKVGDRVVLFDLSRRNVRVIEIKETTRTPKRTPDGFYFAAYRRVRGVASRQLVSNRWKALKASGLLRIKSDAFTTRKLSAGRFAEFVENLKQVAK